MASGGKLVLFFLLSLTLIASPNEAFKLFIKEGIEASQDETKIGDTVDLQCKSISPCATFTWSMVDEEFENNVQTDGAYLRINNARLNNDGLYKCTVRTLHGEEIKKEYHHYILNVRSDYPNFYENYEVCEDEEKITPNTFETLDYGM